MNFYSEFLIAALGFSGFVRAIEPPKARIVPHTLEKHGDVREDDYYWLRGRGDPEVLGYLKAENAYAERAMKSTEQLQSGLFEEMKGRIKEDDSSVPFKYDDYYYYNTSVRLN